MNVDDMGVLILISDVIVVVLMIGKVILLKEVNDLMFGDELMGKGVVFVLSVGEFVFLVIGMVMNVFKMKYVIVVCSDNGMEFLIYVGINIVKLCG